ncbi:MAG: sulfatase-like hydrolase/transferase [Anaerovibrio sp.]|uniref:LTA synthase family protein n=1 Tax=Anaerovibrio sp. TaxID=1872532 RepID=UPI0025FC8BDF|nr:alkaline phosphatase family protein [Anaerovibrio sp.]MCR5176011.1 sulfatase-like hydrolase/transferase [Anaerovibrio sp.]
MIKNRFQFFCWNNFYDLIIRGLKVFIFYLSVLSLFRVIFIGILWDYIGTGTKLTDVVQAVLCGTRLSVQTAGIIALMIVVPAAVAKLIALRAGRAVFSCFNALAALITAVLFFGSIPYYHQFHSRFHQILFNAVNDDMYALFISLVQEFNLPLRFLGAVVVAGGLWWLLDKVIKVQFAQALGLDGFWEHRGRIGYWTERVTVLLGLYIVARLIFFGGSLSWENSVNWENAGVTRDSFLNEAILDDYQAVYRGYRMNGRLLSSEGLDFDSEQIRNLAAHLAGLPADSNNLEVYLTRTALGPHMEKPKHIFVIVSESYANWPLLEKYAALHIADGVKGIISEKDTAYCRSFLPNGGSTVSAVTGIVTGLADSNLYLTTMPESFAGPYPTAIAPQMERLGYSTNFWYAGPSTWERIEAFTLAQGFDHFYGRGSMPDNAEGSVWGCDDEFLYQAVLSGLPADQPSFNVVLNVSNHSPFNVDLDAKGFNYQQVVEGLPEEARDNEELINQLGHFWYADREMAGFVNTIKKRYPDSLIVIVGDHAERYNIDKTPSIYERYGVPFIITGNGITGNVILPDAAGSQIDIGPTIVELIAPKGFRYMSIGSSLTRNNRMGVNYAVWCTHDYFGEADIFPLTPHPVDDSPGPEINVEELQIYIDTMRALSWYVPKYGLVIDDALMGGNK